MFGKFKVVNHSDIVLSDLLRDYIENLSSEIDDSPRISYEIAVAKDLKKAMDEIYYGYGR